MRRRALPALRRVSLSSLAIVAVSAIVGLAQEGPITLQQAVVQATEPFTVPTSIFDEVAEICARLSISA